MSIYTATLGYLSTSPGCSGYTDYPNTIYCSSAFATGCFPASVSYSTGYSCCGCSGSFCYACQSPSYTCSSYIASCRSTGTNPVPNYLYRPSGMSASSKAAVIYGPIVAVLIVFLYVLVYFLRKRRQAYLSSVSSTSTAPVVISYGTSALPAVPPVPATHQPYQTTYQTNYQAPVMASNPAPVVTPTPSVVPSTVPAPATSNATMPLLYHQGAGQTAYNIQNDEHSWSGYEE